jgi:hypothetical protein
VIQTRPAVVLVAVGWSDPRPDDATQVVVTTGHDVAGDQPDVVVREILTVLEKAKAS